MIAYCIYDVWATMKKNFTIRLSQQRLDKLRKVAKDRDKTMTSLIEDWIDRLPVPKKDGG